MLHAIIIDDEQKAIESLSWELSNFASEIKVLAKFTSPEEGIEYIKNNEIDCLFLDIEMPTMDGFQVIEKIKRKNFSIVVTTAYNDYAIKAIKNQAMDYLLKPVDTEDLRETIDKIKKFNNQNNSSEKFEKILMSFNEKLNHKKIAINTEGKIIFLDPEEILFAESDGNYSTIHTTSKKPILVTKKLKEINELLPKDYFFRIHNSFIINLHKVKEFLKVDGYVILENNHKIPVSRNKKSQFLENF